MAIDQNSIEKLLALVEAGDAQLITEIFAGLDINIDPEKLQPLIDDIKVAVKFLEEQTYGPASPEELREQQIRLLTEAVVPGRDIIIEPVVKVPEGEELVLNGSLLTSIFTNEGLLTDTTISLGDNLLGEFFLNTGQIRFNRGQDFVVSRGSGIINEGFITTGNNLDLVSGTATGGNVVDGVLNSGVIGLDKGDDRLIGNGIGTRDVDGIDNQNLITTGKGDDLIAAKAVGNNGIAGINNLGTIFTGQGNDRILGHGTDLTGIAEGGFSFGVSSGEQFVDENGEIQFISNTLIDTGSGADEVVGKSILENSSEFIDGNSAGVINQAGTIRLGDGDDRLFGESLTTGAQNSAGIFALGEFADTASIWFESDVPPGLATIDLGDGNDTVTGIGESVGGFQAVGIGLQFSKLISNSGNNAIQGAGFGGVVTAGIVVDAFSHIKLGDGSDSLTGSAVLGFFNAGIQNDGLIQLGRGSDLIDASIGGFAGLGETQLGGGDDEIRGFGTGQFFGGGGTDTISLGEGIYDFDSSAGTLTSEFGTTMNLRNIEEIKGFNDMQSEALVDGQFVIDANNELVAFPTAIFW